MQEQGLKAASWHKYRRTSQAFVCRWAFEDSRALLKWTCDSALFFSRSAFSVCLPAWVLFRLEIPGLQYADFGISCQFLFLRKDCISFSLHLLVHVSVISVWLQKCFPHTEMHLGTLSHCLLSAPLFISLLAMLIECWYFFLCEFWAGSYLLARFLIDLLFNILDSKPLSGGTDISLWYTTFPCISVMILVYRCFIP